MYLSLNIPQKKIQQCLTSQFILKVHLNNTQNMSHIKNVIFELMWWKDRHELPRWLRGNEFACQCRKCRFDPWVEKISWKRKWQPTHILAGKIQWTEEPGMLQSMRSQRVRHNWVSMHTGTYIGLLGALTFIKSYSISQMYM